MVIYELRDVSLKNCQDCAEVYLSDVEFQGAFLWLHYANLAQAELWKIEHSSPIPRGHSLSTSILYQPWGYMFLKESISGGLKFQVSKVDA